MSFGKRIYFSRQELSALSHTERIEMIEERLIFYGLVAARLLFEGIEGMDVYNKPYFDDNPIRVHGVNFERFKSTAEKKDGGDLSRDFYYPLGVFENSCVELPAILAYDESRYEPAYAAIRPDEVDHYVHIEDVKNEPSIMSVIFLA